MKPEVDGVIDGPRSITGFGFASQVGFESVTAARASSSGAHEISLASAFEVVTRGRVWANAEVDQNARARHTTNTRGNSFRNSINGEVPSLNQFLIFVISNVRRAPLKDLGILAAETPCFNTQCDCFVTKRFVEAYSERKGVTNELQCSALKQVFMAQSDHSQNNARSI